MEIEKTNTTFIISVLKVVNYMYGLIFSNSNFFINKNSQGRKMCSYLLSGIRLYQKLIENGTFDVCKKSFVTRQELNNRDGQNHNVEFHNQNFIGNVYQDFDLTIFFYFGSSCRAATGGKTDVLP